MLTTAAVLQVRSDTGRDTSAPTTDSITDTQITARIDIECVRVRRDLIAEVPELYLATQSTTVANGAQTITLPADFEKVYLLERLDTDGKYRPVLPVDPLNRESVDPADTDLRWRQDGHAGGSIVLTPLESAPGTYKLTYNNMFGVYTSLPVPVGFEQVVIARTAAWVARRFDDSATGFDQDAREQWKSALSALKANRIGMHSRGLIRRRNWLR